ncbi:MAG: hypothetical protein IJ519_04240 [Clostridia bacterium]|nr:hypothetical protein [Clostridia bacterium]
MSTANKSGESRSFSFIFASEDLPEAQVAFFEHLGLKVVPLPAFQRLDAPVAKHADMLLFPTEDGLLLPREYFESNRALFEGVKVICSGDTFSPEYPEDVRLNALNMDTGIICRADSVSEHIRSMGKRLINVAQGYARCTVCKVNGNAIITADPSIVIAAKDNGIDALQICGGEIRLPGYSYGFIGGASVRIGDKMYFTGDITAHPDYDSIEAFLGAHGVTPVSLSKDILTDYGGFVLV